MESIKGKIGQFGLLIGAMGIISMVLSIFDYNVRLLAWVDLWGTTAGWIIRVLLVVVGAALFFMLGRTDDDETTAE